MKIERFSGINNKAPIDRLPAVDGVFAVRDAVNVDLTDQGSFQRRPGSDKVVACTNARNLEGFGDFGLYAEQDKLYSYDGNASTELATLGSPVSRVAYAESPAGIAWTDGYTVNLIKGGVSRPVAPAMPNPEPAVSATTGGLAAGQYGVMCAAVLDGARSAWTHPVFITVADGGGISVALPARALAVEVFITSRDGETFYHEATIGPAQTSIQIPTIYSDGASATYDVLAPLPGGRILGYHFGRLLSVTGAYLFHSLPWAFGLYRPAFDYIPAPENITLVASTPGGLFVATEKATYWLPGGDLTATSMTKVAPYGANEGTLSRSPDDNSLMWFTPNGPVKADPDGSLTLLNDKAIAFPTANRGTSMIRETNGLTQFIASLSGSSSGSAAAVFGSYMDAKSIKRVAS